MESAKISNPTRRMSDKDPLPRNAEGMVEESDAAPLRFAAQVKRRSLCGFVHWLSYPV